MASYNTYNNNNNHNLLWLELINAYTLTWIHTYIKITCTHILYIYFFLGNTKHFWQKPPTKICKCSWSQRGRGCRFPIFTQLSEAKATFTTLDAVAVLTIKLGEGALGCYFHSREAVSSTERNIPITTRGSMCSYPWY